LPSHRAANLSQLEGFLAKKHASFNLSSSA
jgi:hypothetical protein